MDASELQKLERLFVIVVRRASMGGKIVVEGRNIYVDSSLAGLSIWITYCVQVVFAYLTTLCICGFIQILAAGYEFGVASCSW